MNTKANLGLEKISFGTDFNRSASDAEGRKTKDIKQLNQFSSELFMGRHKRVRAAFPQVIVVFEHIDKMLNFIR